MTRILFLCTGNSCRSQMAEGFARAERSGVIRAASAGVAKKPLDPLAVAVMAEAGVDISGQEPKLLADLLAREADPFDYVITVCDHASSTCPAFPGQTTLVPRPFDDPPQLAMRLNDPEEILDVYRRVRDEIRAYVAGLPQNLPQPAGGGPIPPPSFNAGSGL